MIARAAIFTLGEFQFDPDTCDIGADPATRDDGRTSGEPDTPPAPDGEGPPTRGCDSRTISAQRVPRPQRAF